MPVPQKDLDGAPFTTVENVQMKLSALLSILRARRGVALLTLAITVATTIIVSLLLPRTYEASTSLVVNSKGTDALTGGTIPAQLVPGFISTYMSTQTDIVQSMGVALKVVDRLKLTEDPGLAKRFDNARAGEGGFREWIAQSLLDNLKVKPSRESSVMTISYKSDDPKKAAQTANAFAAVYQDVSIDMAVDPSRKAWRYINGQIRSIRDNFEAAQKRVSQYQLENNIVNADSRLDVETARLNELSNRLVLAQDALMEATSRKAHAQGGKAADSPDIAGDPVVQNLRADLARARARLATLSETLTPDHPHYRKAKAEADELRAALNSHMASSSAALGNNAAILEQRAAEAKAALEAQREKVLDLNRKRDELALLTNEMENARRAYEAISQRLTQTDLQGHANHSDIAVVAEALAPTDPSSPKLLLNIALAVVVGGLLGVAAAGMAELRDYRVRPEANLVETFGLPVLGIVRRADGETGRHPRLAGPAPA